MAQRSEFLELIVEQMAGLGSISARSMFGGHGIYCDGLFIAIIVRDKLYLKADEETRPEFEAHGLQRFGYSAQGRTVQLMYYEAPVEVFDESHAMQHWGRLALQAAVRARRPKPARRR